jgi:hypothetical protein
VRRQRGFSCRRQCFLPSSAFEFLWALKTTRLMDDISPRKRTKLAQSVVQSVVVQSVVIVQKATSCDAAPGNAGKDPWFVFFFFFLSVYFGCFVRFQQYRS